jgi:Domain of unknown function (DUF1905)/Bacteriocin-protection, YdeI or OmpD-Associated
MPTFASTLKQEGKTATGIEVPPEIVAQLGGGRKPAVQVTVNGYAYRSTVAVMGGRFMIPVSAEHRQGAGLSGGDALNVTLELDTTPREVVVPGDLQTALDANPAALSAFGKLSYSGKRVHTLSVEGTRNAETRARRVEKAVRSVLEG